MRFVLGLIVAVTVLGAIQANSEEIAVSLASVDNRVHRRFKPKRLSRWGLEYGRDQRGRIRIAGDDSGY